MTELITTLVFGGAGFIGSHLVHTLVKDGRRRIKVTGRRLEPRFPLPEGVEYLRADTIDEAGLDTLLDEADEVVDLAYSTVPKTSFDDPVRDVISNLPVTVDLLKKASEHSLRCFLLVSSGGTVYGNADHLPVDESHPTNPFSPYGITKLATEKYAFMYHKLAGLPVVVVRPGNPYGPNQYGNLAQGFVGAALHAIVHKEKVVVFGDRGTIRDYIFIEDLVGGLLAALDSGVAGEVYNIGTGIGYDNLAVLHAIDEVVRGDGYAVELEHRESRPFDVTANVLSSARLTYLTGWRPETDLPMGLAETWAWVGRQLESR